MTNNDLRKILEKESKPELQVLAKKLGLKSISRLSKDKLINKVINENFSKNKILKELGGHESILWYRTSWVYDLAYFILTLTITIIISPSKSDIKSLGDKITEERLEYLEEIIYLEQYKKIFLESEMNISYKVFGYYNGKLVTKEELNNPNLISNYQSDVQLDFNNQLVETTLFVKELITLKPYSEIIRSSVNQKFPLKENEYFEFGLKLNHCMKFVLLKADRVQPIFAVGVGNCKQHQ